MAPTIATTAAIFLHGQSSASAGDERQQRPREPEERAGREHHVQAGDRDDVVDAGAAQHLVGGLGDEPALAGDERRRDRAGLPADGVGDPLGQRVAGPVDRRDAAVRSSGGGAGGGRTSTLPASEPTAPMPRNRRRARNRSRRATRPEAAAAGAPGRR